MPDHRQATAPSANHWWPVVRAALIGVGLVYVMTAPTLTHPSTVGRLNTDDGRFSIWNVGWVARTLITEPSELLNANIFWPHQGTLAYSEMNLIAGVFGLPWYAATGSALAAHNGAVATGLVLAFVCMWALVRRLSGSDTAGLVSATAFTFTPYVSAHTAHIQLLMTFGIPLMFLSFHRLAARPDWRRGMELGAAVAIAALACGYYGIYAGVTLGVFGLCLASTARAYWTSLAVAVATAAALVYPIFHVFSAARAQSGSSLLARGGQAADWAANVASYLASPAAAHTWWLSTLRSWQVWVEVLFPGFVLLALVGVGVWAARRAEVSRRVFWAYVVVAVFACWASFGPNAGLYRLMEWTVPGIALLRAPARFGIVVIFALAVIAGWGFARLEARRRWLPPAAVVVIAAELAVWTPDWGWPSWPLQAVPSLPVAYQRLATLPRGPVVEYPFPHVRTNFHIHGRSMFWSTYHWQPMVNGYSDVIPEDFHEIAPVLANFPDAASFDVMQARDVKYVVWRPEYYHRGDLDRLSRRIEHYQQHLTPLVRTPEGWLFEITSWPERTDAER